MKRTLIILLTTVMVALSGCGLFNDQSADQDNHKGSFEIYVEGEEQGLACTDEEGSLLSNEDIQSYDLETHTIWLNQAAYDRLSLMELAGQPFLVCADQEPVYSGEFMALWMSRSSEAVIILWPPMDIDEQVMKIQLGYPGPDFYIGADPRLDARILRALEHAGLIDGGLEW